MNKDLYLSPFLPCNATIALQPVVDAHKKGAVAFFEATLRVSETPDQSFHLRLLELAERLGFIGHLDHHVLNLTLQVLTENPGLQASVNISPQTIVLTGNSIIRDILSSRVGPRLIVEITESAAIRANLAAQFSSCLRELGCRVAIDDFDTGYSREEIVRAVRPDLLKVVLETMAPIYQDRLRKAIDLAAELGAHIVVEKVDSPEKMDLLSCLGVRYLQGYSLFHPILRGDLDKALSRMERVAIPSNEIGAPRIRFDLPVHG